MCCLFTLLVLLGPRVANIVWWVADTARWESTFDTVLWPILGIIFLPWTTLMFVLVSPEGIVGLDVVFLIIAVFVDFLSHAGGGWGNRKRVTG
jgi:hypothetical protein